MQERGRSLARHAHGKNAHPVRRTARARAFSHARRVHAKRTRKQRAGPQGRAFSRVAGTCKSHVQAVCRTAGARLPHLWRGIQPPPCRRAGGGSKPDTPAPCSR
eukprot:11214455-Lingulodinium_polyedra.AAC.1